MSNKKRFEDAKRLFEKVQKNAWQEIHKTEFKNPKKMIDIELLETYNHYKRISIRSSEEQDYLALLRNEILERMEN